ncbi:hypothetical protein [Bradyrhizobium sp. JYMT SZCCT0180]|uniref:hypothetical protein n=1 Tax=Bradyrhizobium sp. JYMT SZCCT0180 TaxID=2807666 RepID=UPI001BAB65F6|nr:hypothetical protein [Bradyrhizobium sp. JYMT SZCCT0180]
MEQPQVPERMPLAGVALDAEHHFQPTGRIELVDQVRGNVGCPDVILRVDPQAVRAFEHALAEPADEMAVGIEFHQRHQPAMNDEDVAFGIEGDARRAAKIHARRQLERFGNRDVGKWWELHSRSPETFVRQVRPAQPNDMSSGGATLSGSGQT